MNYRIGWVAPPLGVVVVDIDNKGFRRNKFRRLRIYKICLFKKGIRPPMFKTSWSALCIH